MGVLNRTKYLMKYIASELRDVKKSQGQNDSPIAAEILEVYKLEMFLLAQEVGLENNIKLLNQHSDLLEEVLGEEYVMKLNRGALIDLLKVVTYLHVNYVEATKLLQAYYKQVNTPQTQPLRSSCECNKDK